MYTTRDTCPTVARGVRVRKHLSARRRHVRSTAVRMLLLLRDSDRTTGGHGCAGAGVRRHHVAGGRCGGRTANRSRHRTRRRTRASSRIRPYRTLIVALGVLAFQLRMRGRGC
jgi:hypothetical protein